MQKGIVLDKVNKIYENGIQAVFDFNLEIKDKEFIALVGPSGCGKSTTLRMIAGLEQISYGELNFDGTVMNSVPPKDRNIAMVFQNYALYPHLSAYKNIAFSLKMRKENIKKINEKVLWAAKLLGLTNYLNRKPKDLSGGQRQRVSLGRAIVRNPRLFLMDEPLSNLDAKLREEMRNEIKMLHKKLNSTTIYVTHDQLEAMTMADRIVIMKDGFIQQVGKPEDLFDNPANIFVAKFIGSPQINLVQGEIIDGQFISNKREISFKIANDAIKLMGSLNKKVILGIRPNDVGTNQLLETSHYDTKVTIKITSTENIGNESIIHGVTKEGVEMAYVSPGRYHYDEKDKREVHIYMNKSKMIFFDCASKINISSRLNQETIVALETIKLRAKDYELKNDLLKAQSSRENFFYKIINLLKRKLRKEIENDE